MQQEQKETLQALYVKYQSDLRHLAYKNGLPPEEIDDAIQDTFCSFMEAYLAYASVWSEKQVKAALMRMMRNRSMDFYRKNKRHPGISLDVFVQGGEHSIISEWMSIDVPTKIIMREDLARLRDGILSMSRDMQEVAILYLIENRPLQEVCEILKVSEATCRVRISRIRKYLAEWMENPEAARMKRRGRPKGSGKSAAMSKSQLRLRSKPGYEREPERRTEPEPEMRTELEPELEV